MSVCFLFSLFCFFLFFLSFSVFLCRVASLFVVCGVRVLSSTAVVQAIWSMKLAAE